MVSGSRVKIGVALLPAMILILFLTMTVTTFLLMAQESARQANIYAGKVAAKWTARGGVHVAEKIMYTSDFLGVKNTNNWKGINACFTADTTLDGAPIRPIAGAVLPTAVSGYAVTTPQDGGYYDVKINPASIWQSALWGTSDMHIKIVIAGSPTKGIPPVVNRDIYLKVETKDASAGNKLAYKGNAFNYTIDSTYYKTYYSDFLFCSNESTITWLPKEMDCSNSAGIRVNGFWNVMPWMPWPPPSDYPGDTVMTNPYIDISYYLRVIKVKGSGTRDSEPHTPFGQIFFNSGVPELLLDNNNHLKFVDNPSAPAVPEDLFRYQQVAVPQYSYSYNCAFETEKPAEYQTERSFWINELDSNGWKDFLRDRTSGVRTYPGRTPANYTYSELKMLNSVDRWVYIRVPSYFALQGETPPQEYTRLYNWRALPAANAINSKYGPGVAEAKVMVSPLCYDKRSATIEIDLKKLVESNAIANDNNIFIYPNSYAYYFAGSVAVILKNGNDLSTSRTNNITIACQSTVYTLGNINQVDPAGGIRPTLTIITGGPYYVLSSAFPISNYYLPSSGYTNDYIRDFMPIVNPTFASTLRNDTHERKLDASGFDIDSGQAGVDLRQGQYWLYDQATLQPTLTRNTQYGDPSETRYKLLNDASPTVVNVAFLGNLTPRFSLEYWRTIDSWGGAYTTKSCTFQGPIIQNTDMGQNILSAGTADPTYYTYSPSYPWEDYRSIPTWTSRTNGVAGSSHADVRFYNAGVYTSSGVGTSLTRHEYDIRYFNNPPPILFDAAYRQTYSERLER